MLAYFRSLNLRRFIGKAALTVLALTWHGAPAQTISLDSRLWLSIPAQGAGNADLVKTVCGSSEESSMRLVLDAMTSQERLFDIPPLPGSVEEISSNWITRWLKFAKKKKPNSNNLLKSDLQQAS